MQRKSFVAFLVTAVFLASGAHVFGLAGIGTSSSLLKKKFSGLSASDKYLYNCDPEAARSGVTYVTFDAAFLTPTSFEPAEGYIGSGGVQIQPLSEGFPNGPTKYIDFSRFDPNSTGYRATGNLKVSFALDSDDDTTPQLDPDDAFDRPAGYEDAGESGTNGYEIYRWGFGETSVNTDSIPLTFEHLPYNPDDPTAYNPEYFDPVGSDPVNGAVGGPIAPSSVTTTPEPTALFGLGVAGFGAFARRRRR